MELYSNNLASAQRAQQRWLAAAAESACGVLAELSQENASTDCPDWPGHAKATNSPSSASDNLQLLSGLAASSMDGEGRAAVEQARMQQSQKDAADHHSARLCQRRLQQLEARPTSLNLDKPSAAAAATPPDGASRKRKRPHSFSARAAPAGRPLFSDSHELSIFVGGQDDGSSVHDKKSQLGRTVDGLQRVRISWDGSLVHSLQARCTDPPLSDSRLLIQPQSPPPRLASP